MVAALELRRFGQGRQRRRLDEPVALKAHQEEGFIFADGSGKRGAILVQTKRGSFSIGRIGGYVIRIEGIRVEEVVRRNSQTLP